MRRCRSHLVNTSEQVEVNLARGGGLDEPVKFMGSKLWARAPESLETMRPISSTQSTMRQECTST